MNLLVNLCQDPLDDQKVAQYKAGINGVVERLSGSLMPWQNASIGDSVSQMVRVLEISADRTLWRRQFPGWMAYF